MGSCEERWDQTRRDIAPGWADPPCHSTWPLQQGPRRETTASHCQNFQPTKAENNYLVFISLLVLLSHLEEVEAWNKVGDDLCLWFNCIWCRSDQAVVRSPLCGQWDVERDHQLILSGTDRNIIGSWYQPIFSGTHKWNLTGVGILVNRRNLGKISGSPDTTENARTTP